MGPGPEPGVPPESSACLKRTGDCVVGEVLGQLRVAAQRCGVADQIIAQGSDLVGHGRVITCGGHDNQAFAEPPVRMPKMR